MSEFQWIEFRAIDGPVSPKNLEYMQAQSSRAEITSRSFKIGYHYSEFHGNAVEMLRRGYDFHLNYSNYGIRKLMIRLPQGLPDPVAATPYFGKNALDYIKDKDGPGGIVSVQPFVEPENDLHDLDGLVKLQNCWPTCVRLWQEPISPTCRNNMPRNCNPPILRCVNSPPA